MVDMESTELFFATETPIGARLSARSATSNATPIVFVVDHDVFVRDTVRLLARLAGWQVETFASATRFLERPRVPVPCCLVLDVGLPDMNGLDIQRQLADRPEMQIIFFTGCCDVQTAVRAMKAGAAEFLLKPLDGELLLGAMRDAMERSRTTLARHTEVEALRQRYASLTCRERDVMAHVVRGRLNKQAAAELGISEITVKAHRGNVMRKMKAESLADLVNMDARLRLRAPRPVDPSGNT